MTIFSDMEQQERHAYISGDTKKAAMLAEIIDLRHEVDNLQYRLDEEDDNRADRQ